MWTRTMMRMRQILPSTAIYLQEEEGEVGLLSNQIRGEKIGVGGVLRVVIH